VPVKHRSIRTHAHSYTEHMASTVHAWHRAPAAPLSHPIDALPGGGRRVLVIEDEEDIRELAADWFRDDGFTVETAENGAEALLLLDAFQPDVIVLDLMMPVMDGSTFAEACYRLTEPRAIPTVILSAAYDLAESAARLRPFGVRAFVAKPFDLEVLATVVTRLAERSEVATRA
jgi:CheY-like chemotaxis protein